MLLIVKIGHKPINWKNCSQLDPALELYTLGCSSTHNITLQVEQLGAVPPKVYCLHLIFEILRYWCYRRIQQKKQYNSPILRIAEDTKDTHTLADIRFIIYSAVTIVRLFCNQRIQNLTLRLDKDVRCLRYYKKHE